MNVGQFIKSQMNPSVPSRNQNRIRSGKAGRRMYNGRQILDSIGGYSSDLKAIYAGEGKELCRVVPMETGMRDGKPFRF